jgi:hypothetical protein
MFKVPVPAIVVVPLPLIVPPVQLNTVPTVRLAVPAMVPPLNRNVLLFTAVSAATVTVPPTATVPVPLTLVPAFQVKIPLKLSVDPVAALKLPLLLPPVARFNVPVCTATVPLFVRVPKKLMGEVPLPADFFSVPAFVNVEATPPRLPSP